MTSREKVYAAIDGERDYQDKMTLQDDSANPAFSTGDYITMMQHYSNDLIRAWTLNPGEAPPEVLNNMRKVAAIAVQCMEVHGVLPREVEGVGQWGQKSMEVRNDNTN